jgi:hypothetical protein
MFTIIGLACIVEYVYLLNKMATELAAEIERED